MVFIVTVEKRKDGWYWGSRGPFKTLRKVEEVQQAAYLSGSKGKKGSKKGK